MRTLSPHRGTSLLEPLVAATILALAAAVGVPALSELNGQMTIRAASATVVAILQKARARALYEQRDVGVKWTSAGGDVVFTVYEDGNGNGVLTEEIRKGIDRMVSPPVSMRGRFGKVTFSFLPGFAALDPSGAPIGDLNDPIRFGRSGICTFSPTGSASPGSIYLSDGKGRQEVVRVHPLMSRIQVLEYRSGVRQWERLF